MALDSTTWAALALVLTALGAGWTYVAFQRRGPVAGVRGVAWTLLPIAAWTTGTLKLAGDVVADVGDWASGLVFSPLVWIGIACAGLSVVLFGATGLAARRGVGSGRTAGSTRSVAGAKPAPQVGGRRGASSPANSPDGAPEAALDDDVSEILRRHGIS